MEETGERVSGAHDETKWAPLTTEFWAMLLLIVAALIAAAISDSLNDVRAWTLATIIGAATSSAAVSPKAEQTMHLSWEEAAAEHKR